MSINNSAGTVSFLREATQSGRHRPHPDLLCSSSGCPTGDKYKAGKRCMDSGYCGRKHTRFPTRGLLRLSLNRFKTTINPTPPLSARWGPGGHKAKSVWHWCRCGSDPESDGWAGKQISLQSLYKDKEISDKTEKCTRIDCCQLGAC